jgi:hypothetical protein
MNAETKVKTVEQVLKDLPADTLHSAMARAFADIEAATKDAVNPHFKNKYADLSRVIEAVKPALVQNGLFFTQRCHPAENGVSVETVLHHKGGEDMSLGTLFVPADKQNPQGFGSALTYAKRYALQTAFGVPTEDDDGNAGSRFKDTGSTKDGDKSAVISDAQLKEIQSLADRAGVSSTDICGVYKIPDLPSLPADKFERAKASLLRRLEPDNA